MFKFAADYKNSNKKLFFIQFFSKKKIWEKVKSKEKQRKTKLRFVLKTGK
jgi:hypothetical protein